MKGKIGLVSLGCPKNLVDSEIMLGLLKEDEWEITPDKSQADIIIINTCGFLKTAVEESVNTILEMAACKKGKCKVLIAAGCMAERYGEEVLKEMPEVDGLIGPARCAEITGALRMALEGKRPVLCGNAGNTSYDIGCLESKRIVSTPKGYAYLKIAEGCDNFCTYCTIPHIRGRYRSRKMEDLLKEAEFLAEGGAKEVILVAQDTTRYGADLYSERMLPQLLRQISGVKGVEWIRLLYCYPDEIDDVLIDEIAGNEKICKYIDVPIQHSSDRILAAMGRRGGKKQIRSLIENLRDRIPGVIIRTSLIVGFPHESEEDFEDLCGFVEEIRFDRLGVFKYSKEEGTPAAGIKPAISEKVKNKRYKHIMLLQENISETKNKSRLGRTYRTLVEGISDDGIFYCGRTYAEAPDVDGKIFFASSEPLHAGDFANVRILDCDKHDLIGEVENESAQ